MITTDTEGGVAFRKLASDSVKNVIFFGVLTGFIFEVGTHVRWIGLLLFGIDALFTSLSIVSTIWVTFSGLLILIVRLITLTYGTKNLWWDLINLVQIAEHGFYVVYAVILYRHFFGAAAS